VVVVVVLVSLFFAGASKVKAALTPLLVVVFALVQACPNPRS